MKNIALLIAAGFLFVGCSGEKAPEPKAEAEVNVDLGKQADQLGAAMEKAGENLKEGAEKAKDKLEDAGQALKRNVEEAKDKLTDDKSVEVEVNTK